MKTPVIVLSPLGTNRPAIAIPGVGQIRGISIDNPSGAWLHLRPSDDFIPPYTLGFARTLPYAVTAVDVLFEAPAGQVSTFAGDFPTVVLDTDPVPDSSGSSSGDPFIERFTPVQSFQTGTQFIPVTTNYEQTLIAAIAGKRIRVLTACFAYIVAFQQESPAQMFFGSALGGAEPLFQLSIDGVTHSQFVTFPEGLDWPLGKAVIMLGLSQWVDSLTFTGITYQVI